MLTDIFEQIAIGFLRMIGSLLAIILVILILQYTGFLDKILFYKMLF